MIGFNTYPTIIIRKFDGVGHMHFHWLSCVFNFHKPRRRTVHWDGLNFVGACKACGRSIYRRKRGNWRLIVAE